MGHWSMRIDINGAAGGPGVATAAVEAFRTVIPFVATELKADFDFMLSLLQLHPDDGRARHLIVGMAAESIHYIYMYAGGAGKGGRPGC